MSLYVLIRKSDGLLQAYSESGPIPLDGSDDQLYDNHVIEDEAIIATIKAGVLESAVTLSGLPDGAVSVTPVAIKPVVVVDPLEAVKAEIAGAKDIDGLKVALLDFIKVVYG